MKSIQHGKTEFREEERKRLRGEYDRFQHRLDRLYEDKLDGRITEDNYDRFYTSYREKLREMEDRLALLQDADDRYYITANYLLNLANRAYDLFLSSEIEEKRQLLKLVLQNLRLNGKTVVFQVKKPFNSIMECNDQKDRTSMLPR